MKSNTIYPPMSKREISGAAISREAATQGMVLLKNINGVLPLKGRGKIALFGNGAARTIRGGTKANFCELYKGWIDEHIRDPHACPLNDLYVNWEIPDPSAARIFLNR